MREEQEASVAGKKKESITIVVTIDNETLFLPFLPPKKINAMACTALYFMSLRGDVLIARTYRDEAE